MDEMKIISKFTNGILSKILTKMLRRRLGCLVDIQLNGVRATVQDGMAHIHLDVDAEMSQESLVKILGFDAD